MNKKTTRPSVSARIAAALVVPALCLLWPSQAPADFYRFSGDDGVEVFTNTPGAPGATKVLREPAPKKQARFPRKTGEMLLSTQDNLMPVNGRITSNYGWRQHPIHGDLRHHNGVDIAVPVGTPVKAIAAGTIVFSAARGGYGNLVTVDHGEGLVSHYGHNAELPLAVGERVKAGATVALSGSTGKSTGPHLHFELWRDGVNVTQAYLENGAGIPEVEGGIRSYVGKDGSLVFTNLR